jgi:dTDP-D-glucose 4,6-dehydratase
MQASAVYGTGLNIGDWITYKIIVPGIDFVMLHGKSGKLYNNWRRNELTNLEITHQ